MARISSYEDLSKIREKFRSTIQQQSEINNPESIVQVKVGMGTSGIASGAREVFDFFKEALSKRNINSKVTKVGDMGYCYAEPTVEVILPGLEPVIIGDVDVQKADIIIEKYIKEGELVEGLIPENFEKVD